MKPITLKLSGLQSYREMQQIDFGDLTQMGLFGIFGPTGSGKSTLLDAITLALYGKVERAVNGTQGIMNHSEDALFVSFTFELNSSEGSQQYRVERRFKRLNELSISNSISRFIEVTVDGDQVLADKLADVTRCVEDKIGLKMDDFTRAVVLPQGKFAEFLSLKGSERRQMLQRLFHLEQYGDQLGQKLSRRVKENEATLRTLEAEQQGLGNAGKEALEEAKKQSTEAVTHAEVSRRRLQEIMLQADKLGKVWEWQIERDSKQEQLLQLASLEKEVKELEDKLSKAGIAQLLMPLLTQMQESKQEHLNRETIAKALKNKAQESEQLSLSSIETDEAAQHTLSIEEPKLLIRQDQLEQAVKVQQERDVLVIECQDLEFKKKNVESTQSELHAQLLKDQELLQKGQKKQAELQDSLKSLETRSQDRGMIHKAIQRKHLIQTSEEQQQIAWKEYDQQSLIIAEMSSILESSERELLNDKGNHKLFSERLITNFSDIMGHQEVVNGALRRLSIEEEQLRQDIKGLETHTLSLSLALQLQIGQPCPVCGSEHHPLPAAEATESSDRLSIKNEHMHILRQVQAQVQELKLKLSHLMNENKTLMEQAAVVLPAQDVPQTAVGIALPELNDESGSNFSATFWRDRIHQLEAGSQQLLGDASALRQEATHMKQSYDNLQQKVMKSRAETDALLNIHTDSKSKLERLTADLKKLQQAWDDEFSELLMTEIEEKFELMQKKDAEAEAVRERIEISIPFLEGKRITVQSIEQQIGEIDKALIQLNTQLQGKYEQLKRIEERLLVLVGEYSAESLLVECIQQLKVLKAIAEQSHRARRVAEEVKHEDIKASVIAQQAVDSAREHYMAATSRWEEMLRSSKLSSAEEVVACSLQQEEEQQYVNIVTAHRENERELTSQLAILNEKISDTTLTLEEWEAFKVALEECRNTDEAAIQWKARAERDLEDVLDRHARWIELENMRVERQMKGEQLSKLQSCLRGNAFVEYIAEEQLMQVSQAASQRLLFLTRQRYALEVDSGGGFVIRDDANGGTRRPVSTLSGGETFLTSLSLALALSAQIQLRGQYPLQFFFLDEGFGTLDAELLEMVITSLERLHSDHLSVGIISHVPELRARLPRKLVVLPAEDAGGGSRLVIENI